MSSFLLVLLKVPEGRDHFHIVIVKRVKVHPSCAILMQGYESKHKVLGLVILSEVHICSHMLLRREILVSNIESVRLVAYVIGQVIDDQERESNEYNSSHKPAESRSSLKVYKIAVLRQLFLGVLIELLLKEAPGLEHL